MNRFYPLILCSALLVLTACSDNLFGSGGSSCGNDIKCLRLDAENAFREGKYAKSYEIYDRIVNIDSTASIGYFGMAKAGLWMKGINPADMFALVKTDEGEITLMKEPPVIKNKFLQGTKMTAPALRELERRDSLTYLYEFHEKHRINPSFDTIFHVSLKDTIGGEIEEKIVPMNLKERLSLGETLRKEKYGNFRKDYCNNSETEECPGFPLSDREYRRISYDAGLTIIASLQIILKTIDTNNDDCITNRCPSDKQDDCSDYNPGKPTDLQAWVGWGCREKNEYYNDQYIHYSRDKDGNLVFSFGLDEDYDSFYEKQKNDPKADLPEDIQDINNKLDEFNGNMNDILDVMNIFKTSQDDMPFGWENDINAYKDYSAFYKIGTNIDEDGDGCIGEDIMDGQDNDGDGLKNGNPRLVPIDWNNTDNFLVSGIDNSMAGIPEWNKPKKYHVSEVRNICNNPECTVVAQLQPEEDSVTVIEFTQKMPNYWTTNDIKMKLAVARDTVCGQLNFSLEDRKALIGGCWPNYDEEEFIKYWLKREWARPDERLKRLHPTCSSCTGTACTNKKP